LPEQIPGLIELDLDRVEPDLIVVGQAVFRVQILLFVNETLNLLEDGLVGRVL
jgi:hypothetical protein